MFIIPTNKTLVDTQNEVKAINKVLRPDQLQIVRSKKPLANINVIGVDSSRKGVTSYSKCVKGIFLVYHQFHNISQQRRKIISGLVERR